MHDNKESDMHSVYVCVLFSSGMHIVLQKLFLIKNAKKYSTKDVCVCMCLCLWRLNSARRDNVWKYHTHTRQLMTVILNLIRWQTKPYSSSKYVCGQKKQIELSLRLYMNNSLANSVMYNS